MARAPWAARAPSWGAEGAGAGGETEQVVPWGSRRERSRDLWSNGWCCESESGLEHPGVLLLPLSQGLSRRAEVSPRRNLSCRWAVEVTPRDG